MCNWNDPFTKTNGGTGSAGAAGAAGVCVTDLADPHIRFLRLIDHSVSAVMSRYDPFPSRDAPWIVYPARDSPLCPPRLVGRTVCAHPTDPHRLYITGADQIWELNVWTHQMEPINTPPAEQRLGFAEGPVLPPDPSPPPASGPLATAAFTAPCGLLFHPSNPDELWVCDHKRLRVVDFKRRVVSARTSHPNWEPRNITWSRLPSDTVSAGSVSGSNHNEYGSALFASSGRAVYRVVAETGVVTPVPIDSKLGLDPSAIKSTPSGILVIGCYDTRRVYAVNPVSGAVAALAGTGEMACVDGNALSVAAFGSITSAVLIDWSVPIRDAASGDAICLVTDSRWLRIRAIPLPAQFSDPTLLVPPKSGPRALFVSESNANARKKNSGGSGFCCLC